MFVKVSVMMMDKTCKVVRQIYKNILGHFNGSKGCRIYIQVLFVTNLQKYDWQSLREEQCLSLELGGW